MLVRTKAFVLHSIKQGETGRIVKLYTETEGLISVYVTSTRTKKRGSTAALYQPLTHLELDLEIRPDKDLHRIVSSTVLPAQGQWLHEPVRACVAMFVAELFYRTVQEGDYAPALYNTLAQVTSSLESQESIRLLPLGFILDLATHFGIYPDLIPEGNILDLRDGVTGTSRPLHNETLEGPAVDVLRRHSGMGFDAADAHIDKTLRRSVMDAMILYFKIHIPHFKELKSYGILREVFQ